MEHYHLFLGLDGDGPVYNINTALPGAYAGILSIGPERLLDFLELHLGLSASAIPAQQRLLQLKKSLDKICNEPEFLFYESYQPDPLGVSERLLHLWDSWRMSGWKVEDGNQLPSRMKMIFRYGKIFYEAGRGMADRIETLLQAITDPSISLPPMRITLVDSREDFPFLIAALLRLLATRVEVIPLTYYPTADPNSDLGKLQLLLCGDKKKEDGLVFKNDGSLQLLHFNDDINAATTIFTIMQKTSWKPLVVNRDNGLLNGLALANSKPVCDWHSTGGNGQVLQLFFLATALFKRPLNSLQLQSFLSSPYLPFSRRLAKDLLYSFCKQPGINNSRWNHAIEEYLGSIKGKDGEKKKRKAISFWLQQAVHLDEKQYDKQLLIVIFEELANWAEERAAYPSDDVLLTTQLYQLHAICTDLLTCLQDEAPKIPAAKFERLQVRLFRQHAFSITNAQVGCYDTIDRPGCVWIPGEEILWMNAIREENHIVQTAYWYNSEKEYFRNTGLEVKDESSAYAAYIAGITRMVMSASRQLVLAIPATHHGKEAYEPYCIQEWNQLVNCKVVSVQMQSVQSYCPWNKGANLLMEYPVVLLPEPATYIKIPGQQYFRESESYTSLEKLLQHPVEWFFTYILKLNHTAGLEVPETNQLMGLLADSMVQRLFTNVNSKADWWKNETTFTSKVYKELDEVLSTEGIPLLEHVNKRQLLEFKKALARNTACLRKLIVENKFEIEGTQVKVGGEISGQSFSGLIDLVLKKNKQHFIIDLKWTSSLNAFQQRLANGKDLQLVIYLALLPTANKAAYFLLNNGKLLLRAEDPIMDLKGPVNNILAEEDITTLTVLKKVINGFNYRMQELAEGKLEAAYHLTLEELQPAYFAQQEDDYLYPLTEVDGMKRPLYNNHLQLITGDIT